MKRKLPGKDHSPNTLIKKLAIVTPFTPIKTRSMGWRSVSPRKKRNTLRKRKKTKKLRDNPQGNKKVPETPHKKLAIMTSFIIQKTRNKR